MKPTVKTIEFAAILVVSSAIMAYGIGKMVQFPATVEITKKVAELSGQELMWAFYGYSKSFPIILGILEIAGGIGLLFRRTRFLAIILLSTILVNVILQDIVYGVNKGALIAAIFYQLLLFVILFINREQVVLIFKTLTQCDKQGQTLSLKSKIVQVFYVGLFLVVFKIIEYFLTH